MNSQSEIQNQELFYLGLTAVGHSCSQHMTFQHRYTISKCCIWDSSMGPMSAYEGQMYLRSKWKQ